MLYQLRYMCEAVHLVHTCRMYERKVDVDMLQNAVKSVLANARNVSQHTLYDVQHIHINLTLIHCTFYRYADADQN